MNNNLARYEDGTCGGKCHIAILLWRNGNKSIKDQYLTLLWTKYWHLIFVCMFQFWYIECHLNKNKWFGKQTILFVWTDDHFVLNLTGISIDSWLSFCFKLDCDIYRFLIVMGVAGSHPLLKWSVGRTAWQVSLIFFFLFFSIFFFAVLLFKNLTQSLLIVTIKYTK